jgi:glycerophosphoryl diester phosphodiesterase
MAGLDWLTARPVAHRGLHDAAAGVIENTPAAVEAAIAANYAIEVDLQITADGEAMVHHDDHLGRLTEGEGRLAMMNAAELKRVCFRATRDRMMTLGDLLKLVGGRVALFLELKSYFDGDPRLPMHVAEVLMAYSGPVAAMSFDPDQITTLKGVAPGLPRGLVAERWRRRLESPSPGKRGNSAYLPGFVGSWPHFIAYHVKDLPAVAPLLARHIFGLPLLTWTVRSEEDRQRAARWADQMIFEGFRP